MRYDGVPYCSVIKDDKKKSFIVIVIVLSSIYEFSTCEASLTLSLNLEWNSNEIFDRLP